MLSEQQKIRYCRQLLLPEIDVPGQQRLMQARVLIVGLGGLGNACAAYLAGAGVGTLILADDDRVSMSNLQRQPLYDTAQAGQLKVEAAQQRLAAINPEISIQPVAQQLSLHNPYDGAPPDLILDCTDNMASRFYLNTLSRTLLIPLLSGAATGFEGQFISFSGLPSAPCFKCLYHPAQTPKHDCLSQGISGPVVAIIGLMQAQATINRLLDIPPVDALLHRFNGLSLQWQTLSVTRNLNCTECGVTP
jgi:sulfur carrier protein ThiS adenylyltransferase